MSNKNIIFKPEPKSGQEKVVNNHELEGVEAQSKSVPGGRIIARAPLKDVMFDDGRPGEIVGPGRGMLIFRGEQSLRKNDNDSSDQ